MFERQRVPCRPAGRGEEDGPAVEAGVLDHVEEHLEQPAVGRVEDGARDDQTVGVGHPVDRGLQGRAREAREQVVREVGRMLAQLDHGGGGLDAGVAQVAFGCGNQAVRQQARRRRLAEPCADRDERAGGVTMLDRPRRSHHG